MVRSSLFRLIIVLLTALASPAETDRLMLASRQTRTDESSSSSSEQQEDHDHLVALDHLRQDAQNVTRAGIVDRLSTTTTTTTTTTGICHIATLIAYTYWLPSGQRIQGDFTAATLGGLAAAQLAMHMLNTGDGSVVPEIAGLSERCPLRFTMEVVDSSFNAPITSETTIDMLQRKTANDQREVCAFLGAMTSAETIPMAILTGLQERPQLSPFATSSQLDDRKTFPYFGRLLESDEKAGLSLIKYFKKRNVAHVGIVHWDDDYGNAYVRSIQQRAADDYPELSIVSVNIPSHGATKLDSDWENAVETLARTKFRYFVFLGDSEDFQGIMKYAHEKGIAGTGKHVWLIKNSSLLLYFDGLVAEKDSVEALTGRGLGLFTPQNGRPGMNVFDKFYERMKMLDNEQDIAFLNTRVPSYADLTEDEIPQFTSRVFHMDPSVFASTVFDETIMLGLAACKAVAASESETIHVEGKAMFQSILSSSFHGATGNVTIDPETGSRLSETAVHRITNVVQEELNETHVKFRIQDSEVYLGGEWVEEIPFVFNDGTTRVPLDLPEIEIEHNYIGSKLRAMGYAMTSFIVLASIAFAVWTFTQRNVHIVRASQPIFLLILCSGTAILGSTIIPLSIDDEIASDSACSVACMSAPWLASVGFALIFSGLGAKTWRVNRIFHRADMRRIKLTAMDVMAPLFALMFANIVVLTLWTVVSPLEWERSDTSADIFGRTTETRGKCTSDDFIAFAVILGVCDLGALLLASYQSYKARAISTEFSESDYIGRVIMCMLLVSSVGVPSMVIVSDDPKARFFALAIIIFVLCSAVLLFIFVPKVMYSLGKTFNAKAAVRGSLNMPALGNYGSSHVSESNDQLSDEESSGLKILNQPTATGVLRDNERLRRRIVELEKEMNELRVPLTSSNKELFYTGAERQESAISDAENSAPS